MEIGHIKKNAFFPFLTSTTAVWGVWAIIPCLLNSSDSNAIVEFFSFFSFLFFFVKAKLRNDASNRAGAAW